MNMPDDATLASACAVALAFALDLWRGEPPARIHPVVWMGHYLEWAGRRIAPVFAQQSAAASRRQFMAGAAAWLLGAGTCLLVALLLSRLILQLPVWLAAPLLAGYLKPLFAWSMLRDLVAQTEHALQQGLDSGRAQLAHLVSRNVQELDAAGVRESAIETLAENLSDSVVAPLFWFALLGLPGAALYRFANTADAMWGYPGERGGRYWQWAGKWAARADDVLNWLPARLTALLLMLGARLVTWRRLAAEAAQTPSPNSGWPMAAMALRLGITLGKPGVYRLNAGAPAPQARHTRQALLRAGRIAWLSVALCVLVVLLTGHGHP